MDVQDNVELVTILSRIQAQAILEHVRVTQHAQQEMVEEDVTLDEVLQVVATGQILEYYPEHRRGACCLLFGRTRLGRVLHTVCTTSTAHVDHYHGLRTQVAKMDNSDSEEALR